MVSRFLAYTVPYGYKSTSLFRNSLFHMIATTMQGRSGAVLLPRSSSSRRDGGDGRSGAEGEPQHHADGTLSLGAGRAGGGSRGQGARREGGDDEEEEKNEERRAGNVSPSFVL